LTDTQSILSAAAEALGRKDYDGALACFDRLEREVAASSEIRLLKASVLSSAGRTGEARGIVAEIIAGEPDNTEALYVLSTLEGAGGVVAQEVTKENIPGRMIARMASGRKKNLNGRPFIFTIAIVYNRLETNKSG
jgi:hypothetical protein